MENTFNGTKHRKIPKAPFKAKDLKLDRTSVEGEQGVDCGEENCLFNGKRRHISA